MTIFNSGEKVPGTCVDKLLDDLASFNASRACSYEKEEVPLSAVNVKVTGLDKTVTDSVLTKFFSEYGVVASARVIKKPGGETTGAGVVSFKKAADANKAVEEGNGRLIADKEVTVTFAKKSDVKAFVVPGETDKLAYLVSLHFLPRVARHCAFRLGSSFTDGGAVIQDGKPVLVRAARNLQWKHNWSSGRLLETSELYFTANAWHSLDFVGIVRVDDEVNFEMEMDCGDGWEDVTVNSLKTWQMKGWQTKAVYLSTNRGHGDPLKAVVETGEASFGSHQLDWHLNDGKTTSFVRDIEFGTWFPFTPDVQVFLTRLDTDDKERTSVFARVNRVTSSGFTLEIATAEGSKVHQAGVTWIAYTPNPIEGSHFTKGCYVGESGKDGWPLDKGADRRSTNAAIKWDDTLSREPRAAIFGIDLLDASRGDVVFDSQLTEVSKRGFDVTLSTDYNSKVYAQRTCVLAVAPADRPVQAGEELINYQTAQGWELDRGTGLREFRMWVNFKEKFEDRPEVILSLAGIELEGQTTFDVHVSRVHVGGFEIHASTWGKTMVHALRLRWLATSAGTRFALDKADAKVSSRKCTCVDEETDKIQEQLVRDKKQATKECTCIEDSVGNRKPVYMNMEEGFGGALEFMAGTPKQKPVFYAFKRKEGTDTVPLYYYSSSEHEDRLYTTMYFTPEGEWHGGSVAMYVLDKKLPGSVPLYRFFDTVNDKHRYTVTTEMFTRRSGLYQLKNNGKYRKEGDYRYEGVQCYVFPVLEG